MGYNLRIGEAKIEWNAERVVIDAEPVTLDEAPAFSEPTDKTNSRWPSYSSWAKFCEALGITDVVLNERNGGCDDMRIGDTWISCLMPEHPGVAPVTPHHLEYIERKLAEYKAKHPTHIAEYPPPLPGEEPSCGFYREDQLSQDPKYDGNLCRAEWLVFWLRWSLENCKRPVFVNS